MTRRSGLALVALLASGCLPVGQDVQVLVQQLVDLGGEDARGLEIPQSILLADHLAKDDYPCMPPVAEVLSPPPGPMATRRLRGQQPHYGMFAAPFTYRVGAVDGEWRVMVTIVFDATEGGRLELPDCALKARLEGDVTCEGTAYQDAPGLDVCPDVGHFDAPATRHNLRALLARWSDEAEGYYNRDADADRLPIHYDFEFLLQGDPAPEEVDLRLPLWRSCGRTPYFVAFRSGWSIPIVAHEVGHYLGLLDEYEPLSGIVGFYPKTPFEGSEESRMGISMKPETQVYPLHHYLVLRRYHCGPTAIFERDDVLLR